MKSENNVPEIFTDIKSASDLRKILDNPEHKEYHHFTNIDVLKKILTSKKWKLSPARNMNDRHEANDKNSLDLRARIYSTCFSHGYHNDMAMWAMYGLPWDRAVRITISHDLMLLWMKKLRYFEQEYDSVENISLHDIAYCRKYNSSIYLYFKNKEYNETQVRRLKNIVKSERLTGYIKNVAWRQEAETRLALTFCSAKVPRDSVYRPDVDACFIPIDVDILSGLKIVLGPLVISDKNEILEEIFSLELADKIKLNIRSNFYNNYFKQKVLLKNNPDTFLIQCRVLK